MSLYRSVLVAIWILGVTGSAAWAQSGSFQTLYSFAGAPDGSGPDSLIQVGQSLYGATFVGGSGKCGGACGPIFSFQLNTNLENVVSSFKNKKNGYYPSGKLALVGNTLYGLTENGGTASCGRLGCGTVFSIDTTTSVLKTVYSFQGSAKMDGSTPFYSGLLNVNGVLYGTTVNGGLHKTLYGTLFSINIKTGVETVLHEFGNPGPVRDGDSPYGGLIDVGGILYGTTYSGGNSPVMTCGSGCGTVFSFDLSTGAYKTLYSFQGGSDGGYPTANLLSLNGLLYGTTVGGGSSGCTGGCGTIFVVNPTSGSEQALYAFGNTGDGYYPNATLLQINDTLYGTTSYGGAASDGILFSYSLSSGTEQVLHSFEGSDGTNPGGILLNIGNVLYGTAGSGGAYGYGTVFEFTP